jgi:hypothetical protein
VFKYSSRFWLYAPTGLFLLLAAAAMIHWWIVANAFEKKLAGLKGKEAIPGITVDWDTVDVGGFPFRLEAGFTNLHIQGAAAHGPLAWTSDKFALHALTYGRSQVVYEAAGRQALRWTARDGSPHQMSFLPGSMRGSSLVDKNGLARFDLDIVQAGDDDFSVGRFQFHIRRDPDGSDLDLMVRTDGLRVEGLKMGNLQFYATLDQVKALAPLLRGEASWPETVRHWREQGGRAKMSNVLAATLLAGKVLSPLF